MSHADSLRELFEQALDLPAAERDAFLAQHCPDLQLRARIERLLAADSTDESPLEPTPPAELMTAMAEAPAPIWQSGQQIGGWTLREFLGEGGSATVFRATRDVEGTLQHAAIKLLHRNLHSAEAQRLFRRERQALAALDHPNIAHLIDGGVTSEGTGYLVIAYVDGLPINDYAVAAGLDLRSRLAMMAVACRAVAAAHRNLIVHRDLKPANILVASDGTVKLLDFGIAKLLDPGQLPIDATRTGFAPLTPGYAAPEQFEGGTITTATDVYALGVILYELLLGERPPRGRPPRPSAHADELPADARRLPAPRTQLRAALRGDLDTLLEKALADEPSRRYAGADPLADDIERYLASQPIHAHPPSRWYRTRKFVQRHRGGVVVTLALLVAILCTSAIALWQAHVARQEAQRANVQALRAQTVRDLLVGLFDAEIPTGPRNRMPDTAELLQRGTERALRDLDDAPAVQSELLTALGRVYDHLAQPDKGEPVLDAAVAAARRVQPPDPALLAAALSERGALENSRSRYDAAVKFLDEALSLQQRAAPDSIELSVTLDRRAQAASNLGDHDRAIELRHAANAIRSRRLPADSPEHLHGAHALGTALMSAGRYDEAEPPLQQAARGALARYGDAHVKSAHYLKNLATLHGFQGRIAEAAESLRRAVNAERNLYPPGSPVRGLGLNNLGAFELRLGNVRAALELFDEARSLNDGAGLGLSLGQAFVLANAARAREILGDVDAATADLGSAEAAALASVPASHPRTLTLRLQRARLDFARDATRKQELLAAADAVIAAVDTLATLRARNETEAHYARATALTAMGRTDEAAHALDAALDSMPAQTDPLLLPRVAEHVEWLHREGHAADAQALLATWRARAERDIAAGHFALGRLHLAAAAVAADSASAAGHARNALQAFEALPPSHPWRHHAQQLIETAPTAARGA